MRLERICQHCQTVFTAKTTVTKYCGDVCAKRAYKARKRKEKIENSKQQVKTEIQAPIIQLNAKEFLTRAETCRVFGISRTTLWRLIKQGKLKPASIGKKIIIKKSDLDRLFN